MNQSLEKIIIIGLNLTLLVAIGVPLLFSTTQIISQSEQTITFQNFVHEVDEAILTADQERVTQTKQIIIPTNVSLEVVNTQLIFKIYLDDWHMVSRTYRCPIQIDGIIHSGAHRLTVSVSDTLILLTFERI